MDRGYRVGAKGLAGYNWGDLHVRAVRRRATSSPIPGEISSVCLEGLHPGGVNRFIDAELGLNSDSFWAEIGSQDPPLQTLLIDALHSHPSETSRI